MVEDDVQAHDGVEIGEVELPQGEEERDVSAARRSLQETKRSEGHAHVSWNVGEPLW